MGGLGDVGHAEGVAEFVGGRCLNAPLAGAARGTLDVPVLIGLVQLDVGLDDATVVRPPAGQSEIARWKDSKPDHVVPVLSPASTPRADIGRSAGHSPIQVRRADGVGKATVVASVSDVARRSGQN